MQKAYLVFGAVIVFVFGMFMGVKIIDNNKSVYAQVSFGDAGNFTVGKQLDLTNLSSFHPEDAALLISGIKKLNPDDEISNEILEMKKSGSGLFTPEEFIVKLHITDEPVLGNGIAAICESEISDFHKKTISIFDNRPGSSTKRMIRVGAWNTLDSAHCLDKTSRHVWISMNTANLLFPENSPGNDVDLLGRVSNSCKAPRVDI